MTSSRSASESSKRLNRSVEKPVENRWEGLSKHVENTVAFVKKVIHRDRVLKNRVLQTAGSSHLLD